MTVSRECCRAFERCVDPGNLAQRGVRESDVDHARPAGIRQFDATDFIQPFLEAMASPTGRSRSGCEALPEF
jgi:hypothetical protein